jgi:predicted ATPase
VTDRLGGRVIRTPDQRLRVFVSSTLEELADERAAVRDAVLQLHLAPVMFELGARPHPPRDLYRAYLDQSHVFVGIYWQRYGWIAPGEDLSGLEDEYRLSGDRPKLIYVKRPALDREPRLDELLDRVRSDDTVSYKSFASAEELGTLVVDDLVVLLSERFEASSWPEPVTVPTNLPAGVDRFIGRTKELQEIKDRLTEVRLLSLVGPGGSGKTRLALQAAAELCDDFGGQVYFVDLASSRDVDAVLSAMARAIGAREDRSSSLFNELKGHIGTQRMLLLLDNFEQVTVAAPTAAALLRACPGLTELVTSREPLHVSGENVFPVPPLALPQLAPERASVGLLSESEAVELFVERARAVEPDFQLTPANAPAVAELCVRMDGLPLAIELATARLGAFTPQALVERLAQRFTMLKGGARDAPLRQQTLEATIGWSYDLLEPDERRVFELLAVFSGATFGAVEEVSNQIDGLREIDVVEVLASLLDKSLLRRVGHGDADTRLEMLESIREYAAARLDAQPELRAAAHRAHASFFADWTRQHQDVRASRGHGSASAQIVAEIDNIDAAWRYWVGERDLERLGSLTDSLWPLYDAHGWYHAMLGVATDLLDVLSSVPRTPELVVEQITLQTSLARIQLARNGYTQEVEDAYTSALELCEGAGEIPQLLPVLRGLSSFYAYRAEFEKGARIGEQILGLAQRLDDADALIDGHLVVGVNLVLLNRLQEGREHLERAMAAYDSERSASGRFQLGNNPGVVSWTTSALTLWMQGFPDRARERADEATTIAELLHHPSSIAYANFHSGLIHLWEHEHELAEEDARAVLDVAEEHDLRIWIAVGSCLRGAAMAGMGRADEGVTLIGEAMKTYQRLAAPPVFWPMLLHVQAGACGAAGRHAEALALIDEAVAISTQGPGRTMLSEFFQLRGELLLAATADSAGEAEAWFRRAVDAADEARAPMLQLRAALRLGRLWQEQGRIDEARDLLAEATGRITEGFSRVDMRHAALLLADRPR